MSHKHPIAVDPGAVAILRGDKNAPQVDGTLGIPQTLDEVIATFGKWLFLPDPSALKITLGAVAANLAEGDPLWLLLVGATGSGKTELLDPLLGLPNVYSVGTLTEASLLSGSPKRETGKDASGGLLRQMGDFGFLVLKDFTTILSMGKEIRGPLLAALREISDGHWTRHVGVDGGRTIAWKGKCALIAGCTPAIDQHHALMATMGERFLLFRTPPMDQEQQAVRAMQHVTQENKMRRQLREAAVGLFNGYQRQDRAFSEDSAARMAALATLVARARSAVERDSYKREIELIPDSEMPGRLACSLKCLFHGLQNIGVADKEAWRLIGKVGLDCIPDVRRKALTCLNKQNQPITTKAVAQALAYPWTTVRRVLEDLTGHGLVQCFRPDSNDPESWQISSLFKELIMKAQVDLASPEKADSL